MTASQLLPCPNPWCARSQPRLFHGHDRKHRAVQVHVACEGCQQTGEMCNSVAAAVAAWNTRVDPEFGRAPATAWHDADEPAPEGEPVMALYRAFGRPDGRWMKHVVWWLDGGWRIYPFTANRGFVERWQPLAAA